MKRKSTYIALIVFSMLLLSFLLFSPKEEKSLSDLISISISSSSSDIRQNYSFFLYKENESWLLNAHYCTFDTDIEMNIENKEIDEREVKKLFEILDDYNKKKGRKSFQISSLFFIPDKETYSFVLTFSDKSQHIEKTRKQRLEEFFYSIVKK